MGYPVIRPGTNNHSNLLNLNADDHVQYHTDARGDIRYYTKAEIDARTLDNINDVNISSPNNNDVLTYNTTTGFWESAPSPGNLFAEWGNITGVLSNQTDLQTALDNKSDIGHMHVKADITDFSETDYATSNQGLLADSALQPGDNVSELINDAGYLTFFTEVNDLTTAVIWANVPDANITASSVIQHESLLTITESQISDLQPYLVDITNQPITELSDVYSLMNPSAGQVLTYDTINGWQAQTPSPGVTDHFLLTNIGVNDHYQIDAHISDGNIHFTMGSISITESQISDFGIYEPAFVKNTAFNKDFGTIVGTVSEGNHLHNIWETFQADNGTVTTTNPTETLSIIGGVGITTTIVGNTLTVDSTLTPDDMATVQIRTSANISISTSNTFQDIPFDVTDIENNVSIISHDVSLDRILINETGMYDISLVTANSQTMRYRIRINDNTIIPGSEIEAGYNYTLTSLSDNITINCKAYLTAGQYITAQVATGYPTATLFAGATMSIVRLKGTKGDTGPAGPPGSGTEILVKNEGTLLPNTPHSVLDFTGNGVNVIDNGDGSANVNITKPQSNVLFCYNAGVSQTLNSSFIVININAVIRSDTAYTVSAINEVTINESGWYKITYDVSANAATSTRSIAEHQLQKNGVEIPGSKSWSYHRTTYAGKDTASATIITQLNVNDVIRLRSREQVGQVVTLADGCRLTIEQLF